MYSWLDHTVGFRLKLLWFEYPVICGLKHILWQILLQRSLYKTWPLQSSESKDSPELYKHPGGGIAPNLSWMLSPVPVLFLPVIHATSWQTKGLGFFLNILVCLVSIIFGACLTLQLECKCLFLYCFCGFATKAFWLPIASKSLEYGNKLFIWIPGMECKFNSSSLKLNYIE